MQRDGHSEILFIRVKQSLLIATVSIIVSM